MESHIDKSYLQIFDINQTLWIILTSMAFGATDLMMKVTNHARTATDLTDLNSSKAHNAHYET